MRSSRVRDRTVLALLSAFLTFLAPGCLVAPHDSFATPQDTVMTFQSAYARGDEFKEYDCFAHELNAENGVQITQQAWSTLRGQVFAPLGTIGRFVLRRNSLEDNLVGGTRDGGQARLAYE